MDENKINLAQIQKFLSQVEYPTNKDQLVESAQDEGADVEILDLLDLIEDKDYSGPMEVNKELRSIEEKMKMSEDLDVPDEMMNDD